MVRLRGLYAVWHKLKITLEMIAFEHTVFALPFALIAALLAQDGIPGGRQIFWIVAAMVGARSAAMTFNRIVDLDYDRANPRTRGRALPSGRLSMGFAIAFTVAMSALFVVSAGMLNRLCLYLSLPTLIILLAYSYTKRFTLLSHLVLGFAIGLGSVGIMAGHPWGVCAVSDTAGVHCHAMDRRIRSHLCLPGCGVRPSIPIVFNSGRVG